MGKLEWLAARLVFAVEIGSLVVIAGIMLRLI
jgi:hypothetical protein